MEEAYKIGYLRAIGVSNFYPDRLIDLCRFVEVTPAVNQVETHVFQQQKKAHEYMLKYEVQHESWGPFAEGRKDFFTNPTLTAIGAKHGKTAAQAALRFLLQSGVVVIPKSIRSGWSRISMCSTSSSRRRIWPPLPLWTRGKACFSPIMTPPLWK